MEVVDPRSTSTCLDINSSGGSSTDRDHPTQHSSKDLSMHELKTCLTEFLDVENTGSSSDHLIPGKDYVVNVVKEYACQGLETPTECNSASERCLSKSATFPPPRGPKSSVDSFIGEKEEHEEDISDEHSEVNGSNKPTNKCYSRSISLPVPLKLVSALKGSRGKHGIPPKNLSVTWAPDVYDPTPTSLSHVPSNGNQNYRCYSRKSGKYKQKSSSKSSSRSSKGKDKVKKQVRRSGGGSTKLRPFYCETIEYDIGTPDPFCGSSFLTKSVSNLHFSVAEAT